MQQQCKLQQSDFITNYLIKCKKNKKKYIHKIAKKNI